MCGRKSYEISGYTYGGIVHGYVPPDYQRDLQVVDDVVGPFDGIVPGDVPPDYQPDLQVVDDFEGHFDYHPEFFGEPEILF